MIRVIIERHIAPTLEGPYEQVAKRTLQTAIAASGFVSGESLKDCYDPNRRVILSTWRSVQDWQRWAASEERKNMMAEMSPILETEEKVNIFELA